MRGKSGAVSYEVANNRALVNNPNPPRGGRAILLTDAEHEAAVEAFMAIARATDPEKCALVCAKHQVKSRRQLRRISEFEIPVGLYPGKFASDADRQVAPITESLERTA